MRFIVKDAYYEQSDCERFKVAKTFHNDPPVQYAATDMVGRVLLGVFRTREEAESACRQVIERETA